MKTKQFIGVVAALAALCVLAGVVYAYDNSHKDHIAKGISVGGVEVGGLTRAAAQRRLEARLLGALHEPIVVHHGKKTFKLGPRKARIAADINGMVDEAIARSRDGGMLKRTLRDLTGGKVIENLDPRVTYDKRAVVRLLDKIRRKIDRPAIDATIKYNPNGFTTTGGVDGLKVRASDLHKQIDEAIISPTAKRTFVAHTRHTKPKVTTKQLAKKYETVVVVNRGAFKLRLFKNLKLVKTYGIAVGQVGLETPAGEYHVENKAVNPAWHVPNSPWAGKLAGTVIPGGVPENPIRERWMGIYAGAGIHGTTDDGSIGSAASHGCIRMHIPDVIELYDQVPVGAPVYIA